VAGVRFSSNVEVLLRVLWELLEEESKECVNILSSSNGIADRATAVRIAHVDWLIEEDHRSIGIPGVWVVVELQLLVDGGWAKLKE